MHELTDIVPPLELCMGICGSTFDNSALVWAMIPAKRVFWAVCERKEVEDEKECCLIPAPTLAEILQELPKYDENEKTLICLPVFPKDGKKMVLGDAWAVGYSLANSVWEENAATAALKLWQELGGAEE